METAVKIEGLNELLKNFELGERDIRNFARGATHKVAAVVRKKARSNAPKDEGRLRKAIKAKRRRARGSMFRSDVNVATGASRSDPKGAFYWFFLEYGTVHLDPQPFIGPAIEGTRPEAHQTFRDDVLKRAIKKMEQRAKA